MIARDSVKVLVLDIVSFFGQGAIYMVNLALVYYLRYSLDIPAGIVGLAASSYTLAFFLGCMFLYPVYARFSSSTLIGASFIGMSVPICFLLQTDSLLYIFLCLGLYGLSMSLLWAPLEAWMMDTADEGSINRIIGSFNFSWSLGAGLSPLIATWIVSRNPRDVFWSGIAVFILLWLTVFVLSRRFRPVRIQAGKDSQVSVQSLPPLQIKAFRVISWSAAFTAYAIQAIILNVFPMFAHDVLSISEQLSGKILFIRGMATCFFFIFLSRFSWWQLKFSRIIAAEIAIMAVMAGLGFSDSLFVISLSILLFGLLFSLCVSFSAFHSAYGIGDKVKTMRIHEGVINLGSVAGSAIGGIIYGSRGYHAVWLILAAFLLIVLAVQLIYYLINIGKTSISAS